MPPRSADAVAKSTATFGVDLDHLRELCGDRVDYVVVSHASNVTGCVLPIKEMAHIAHERGGLLILDAAQSAGDLDIDMHDLGVDVLAAPGHKGLYGPMGTGVLVLSAPLEVQAFREGGTGFRSESPEQPTEYPWRLEAGTINLPGIAGLAAGIRFVGSAVADATAPAALAQVLADELRQIDGVRVFCDSTPVPGSSRSGLVRPTSPSPGRSSMNRLELPCARGCIGSGGPPSHRDFA